MSGRLFSSALWGLLYVAAVSASCGKDRNTRDGVDEIASEVAVTPGGQALEEITPDNHIPLDTHRVNDYAIDGFAPEYPLTVAGDTSNEPGSSFAASRTFRLADPTAVERFYVGHPITLNANISVDGGTFSTVATFGLIQKPREGAPDQEIAALHTCMIGNIPVTHSGATPEGNSQSFHGTFRIPEECLPEGKTSDHFYLYMAVDIEGSVYSGNDGNSRPRIVVLDTEYIKTNNICLRLRENGPCVEAIQIDASPGVNIHMEDAKATSSVATFDAFFDIEGGDTPVPLIGINSDIVFEGISEDHESRLEYEAKVSYSICATTSADPDKSSCADTDWADLVMLDPKSDAEGMSMTTNHVVDNLIPGETKSVSSTLYARSETFESLKQGGKWGEHKHFLIRTCVDLFKNGARAQQKNITHQAASADATHDDCRYIPVLMSDVRKTPEGEGQKVCTDANGNPTNTPGQDCIPANEIGENLALTNFQPSASNGKLFNLSESTKLEWGKSGLLMMRLNGGIGSSLGVHGATFDANLGLMTDGFWRSPIKIFEGAAEANIPLTLEGAHALNLSMFGLKLFSRSGSVIENYQWTWEPAGFVPKKERHVVKAKRYDAATRKIVPVSTAKAPPAIAVKEYCQSVSANISFVRISLELCAESGLYLDAGFNLVARKVATDAEKKELPGSVKFAKVEAYFIPSVAASVLGAAYGDVILARVGIEGLVTLIEVGFPARTYVMWGQPANESFVQVRGNVNLDMDMVWLDGRVIAFADIRGLKWCKAWIIRYPCGLKWNRIGTYQFASFRGGSRNYSLYNKSLVNTVIPLTSRTSEESLITHEEL